MKKWIFTVWISLLCLSCDRALVYSQYEQTLGGWKKDDKKSFVFSVEDTLSAYNLFLMIRNDNSYPFDNLYVITDIQGVDNHKIVDTLQYQMYNAQGKSLGQGLFVNDNKLWYKEGVRFPVKGNYTFTVSQAMRRVGQSQPIEILEGVTQVGFRVEKQQ